MKIVEVWCLPNDRVPVTVKFGVHQRQIEVFDVDDALTYIRQMWTERPVCGRLNGVRASRSERCRPGDVIAVYAIW